MRHVIQKSLFNEKGSFDKEDFEGKCMNDTFSSCVSNGILTAVEKVSSANLQTRMRVRSDSVHDVAFMEIQNNIYSSELYNEIDFHCDETGTKRLFFSYNGYVFILRKAESIGNKSGISDIINSQKANRHVITIEYTISKTWDDVVSISFQYIRNGVAEVTYYVPITRSVYSVVDNEPNSIKDAKATLKTVARKAE